MRTKWIIGVVGSVAIALAVGRSPGGDAGGDKPGEWKPLFNGKSLAGWDTWLGRPHGEKEIVGLNKDPRKVYTVVKPEGEKSPCIRISGEIFGALTSQEEYESYHLKLEFKWGEKKWPPRDGDKVPRDSGLLYHCVGGHGAAGSFWMRSQECQIQEKDCGDYWSVAGGMVDVEAVLINRNPFSPIKYKKGGNKMSVPRTLMFQGKTQVDPRIVKDPDNEKANGEWNTIELFTVGQTSVHVVNGKVVMVLTNSRHRVNDKETPLTKGKIQLQSEGAEIYYRNIAIRSIGKIPEEYLK